MNIQLNGIVLRAYHSGEADLVLKVLTPQKGNMALIAKHARSSKRRFLASFDIFDHGTFDIKRGRGTLWVIQSFSPQKPFLNLRNDLNKLSIASLVSESFDTVLREESEELEELYSVLELTLEAIDQARTLNEVLKAGFIALVNLLQYSGVLDQTLLDESTARPSTHKMYRLMEQVETQIGRELSSRAAVTEVLEQFKKVSLGDEGS